jgi:integrase
LSVIDSVFGINKILTRNFFVGLLEDADEVFLAAIRAVNDFMFFVRRTLAVEALLKRSWNFTFIDTRARISELAGLKLADVDPENGYLRVMGKGGKERYLPFGQKAAKALIKYQILHRPEPSGVSHWFWLTAAAAQLWRTCLCERLRHNPLLHQLAKDYEDFPMHFCDN